MQIKSNLSPKLNLIKQINQDLTSQGYTGTLSENDQDVTISAPVKIDGVVDSGNDTTVEANTTVTITYDTDKTLRYSYRRLSLEALKTANNVTDANTDYVFKAHEHTSHGTVVTDYPQELSKAFANKWNLGEKDLVDAQLKGGDLEKGVKTYRIVSKADNYLVAGQLESVTVRSRDGVFGEAVLTGIEQSVFFSFTQSAPEFTAPVSELYMPYNTTSIPSNYFMNAANLDGADIHFSKITDIGDYAFKNAISSMTQITLPRGVSLGEGAFMGAHTQDFDLKEDISVSLDSLGTVDNLTVDGDVSRLAEVLATRPGGEHTNYIYRKNQEAGQADSDHEVYSVVKVKNSTPDIYLTKEELATPDIAVGMSSGFIPTLSDITLSKDIDILPINWFNMFEGDSVNLKHVKQIQGFSFTQGAIEDLYLGAIDPTRIDDNAFSSTTITRIHVPDEDTKNKLMGINAFSNTNLANVPEWVVESPSNTSDIPEELTSTGLNYNP